MGYATSGRQETFRQQPTSFSTQNSALFPIEFSLANALEVQNFFELSMGTPQLIVSVLVDLLAFPS